MSLSITRLCPPESCVVLQIHAAVAPWLSSVAALFLGVCALVPEWSTWTIEWSWLVRTTARCRVFCRRNAKATHHWIDFIVTACSCAMTVLYVGPFVDRCYCCPCLVLSDFFSL
mmetsp:Transcript_633/g.1075  ORF Transcript_633/g.1075 Transcript_633/m.1075 type:complete len:114 (+) Transcript_633:717-1058(+)|eukprot:scaffold93239_cov30-Tisochrysis_lutea.AAC.3